MRVRRLNNNNEIIQTNNEIIFVSYESIIAILKNNELTLGNDWDYSRTTLKYLYQFLNMFYISEEIDKALKSKNIKENLQKLIDNNKIKFEKSL